MIPVSVGDRIWFAEERIGYTIQAVSSDARWAACTKPFPLHRTVIYTVIDFQRALRGVDDCIGSLGYETREECQRAIEAFEAGEFEHSRRPGPIPLNVRRWVAEEER